MQLFFSNTFNSGKAFLDEEETRHCKVLRKNTGDKIHVIDGKGYSYTCLIIKIGSKETELEILESNELVKLRDYRFHLIIAPTKQNDRIEWMLEKAIETGLDEITFISCEHSEKTRINIARLEKIAISAIKQSGQGYLPKINPLIELNKLDIPANTFLAHCREDSERLYFSDALKQSGIGKEISVLIGPEGDFSEKEIQILIQKGAIPVSFGKSRLRTETAGIYAAVSVNCVL